MQTSVARNIFLGPKRVLSVGRSFSQGQSLKFRGKALFRPMINSKALTAGFLFSTSVYWYLRNYCWADVVLASEPVLVTKSVEMSRNLMEGQMKEIIFGDDEARDTILIARVDGKVYAVSGKCSHYSVNLKYGQLFADRVYCPAHMASFSVKTGLPDGGPALNALQTFECWESAGEIFVKAPDQIRTHHIAPPMAQREESNHEKFVILGGGPAGLSAAETLRQSGFTGEIVVISNEEKLPYDTTTLTKRIMNVEHEGIQLRSPDFLEKNGISYILGKTVGRVDSENKCIELKENNELITYDKLLLATGSSPRCPPIKGLGLKNVFTIRHFEDAKRVREAAGQVKNIVIIGASFIGMEAASAIKTELKEDVNIVVVDMIEPFSRVLGNEVGSALKKLNEDNGIKFLIGKGLSGINGENSVESLQFDDGTSLPADMVILGTGVKPNTEFLANSGVRTEKFGHVTTDVFLKTSDKNIFAAGDLASTPWFYNAERIVCEHWSNAIQQGSYAAWNMLGKQVPYDMVPMFWTRQWANNLYYTGFAFTWDKVILDGDVKDRKFLAYYVKDGRVNAVAGMGRTGDIILLNQAMRLNCMPILGEFKNGKMDLEGLRQRVDELKPSCGCRRQKIIDAGLPKK